MGIYSDTYEIIDAVCIRETNLAILIEAPELNEPMWIPHSQMDDDSEVNGLWDEGTCIISFWFAREKGLV